MDIDFGDVLEQSRALAARRDAGGVEELPRLERGLRQIDDESSRLARAGIDPFAPGGRDEAQLREASAAMLLSEYGFEANKLETQLQSIALMDTLEPLEPFSDTDLEAFLRHQREMLILGAVEEVRQSSQSQADRANRSQMEAQWTIAKRDMLSTTSLIFDAPKQPSNSRTAPSIDPFTSSFRSTSGTGTAATRTRLDVSYAAVVQASIQVRLSAALAQDFYQVAHDSRRGQHIQNCFLALKYLTRGKTPWGSETLQFSPIAARQFLETLFLESKVKRASEINPIVARRGGRPEVIHDICAYLNLVFEKGVPDVLSSGIQYNGRPFWPQLYYCLRCGEDQTAAELVHEVREQLEAAENCRFLDYFQMFRNSGDRRSLPNGMVQELAREYTLSVYPGVDPYKRVCYILISRLDPTNGNTILLHDVDYDLLFASIEDYAWLKLSVLRTPSDPVAPSSLSQHTSYVQDFQDEMIGFDATHFDPNGTTPFLYGFVLLLCGKFQKAVDYVARSTSSLSDAIHLAFVLYAFKGISADDYEPILIRYVRRFSQSDPYNAALYISTLSEPDRHAAGIQRLLLETEDLDVLLGVNHGQSTRPSSGTLEKIFGEVWHTNSDKERLSLIVLQSAREAQQNAEPMKALRLYQATGSQSESEISELLLEMLGPEMNSAESPHRRKAYDHARQVASTIGPHLHNKNSRSLEIMFLLYRFFDLEKGQKHREAWDLLRSKSFLPTNDSMLVSKLRDLGPDSDEYHSTITDSLGNILVAAMQCVVRLHSEARVKGQRAGGSQADPEKVELEICARTLANFAGMMKDMDSDVSARLVRLEVFMS